MYIPWGSAVSGFNEGIENNRRKRVELAQAWEQYKQANPHATLAEMQSWIDTRAGGRNYIAAGAPSGSVLQGIADENAKRKQRDQSRQAIEDLDARNSLAGRLRESAESYILDSGGDMGKAMKGFASDLGMENLDGFDVSGIFTEGNYQRTLQKKTQEHLGEAMELAGVQEGLTADDLSGYLGVPKPVAEALLKRVETEQAREAEDREAAKSARARQAQSDLFKNIQTVYDYAQSNGIDMREAAITVLGIEPADADTILPQSVLDEHVNRHEAGQKQKHLTELRGRIDQDPAVAALLKAGDIDGARRLVQQMLDAVPQAFRPGTTVDELIGGQLRSAQLAQADQRKATYDKTKTDSQALWTKRQEEQDANVRAVADSLGKDEVSKAALTMLGSTHAMTPDQIVRVADALRTGGFDNVREAMDAMVTQFGLVSQSEAQESFVNDRLPRDAGKPMIMADVLTGYQSDVTEVLTGKSGVDATIAKATGQQQPEATLEYLDAAEAQAMQLLEGMRTLYAGDKADPYSFLKIGETYDDVGMQRVIAQAEREVKQRLQQIGKLRTAAQQAQAAQASQAAPAASPAASAPAAPTTPVTQSGRRQRDAPQVKDPWAPPTGPGKRHQHP
ncbi:hypothetical protein [Poseidonocella sp. HB161398]|uniref:hypothetical protein n=1 Tax=Poseidonocella sp. HB161398 TaxID=2320855 RepID=UPI001109714E|nr:hypothetical protein [Poseidonocella sp. HB161398]